MLNRHPVELGELTQRVSLRRRTLTDDGAGGATEALAEYAQEWAHIRPLGGDEQQAESATRAARKYLVVIRNRDDVREDDVCRWIDRSRDLNIRFLRDRGARALYLELEAEAGVPT